MMRGQFKGRSNSGYFIMYILMALVIAGVGGTIFSLVQNQIGSPVETTLDNQMIKIEDKSLSQRDLTLNISSNAQDQIEIKEIRIKDSETGLTSKVSPNSRLNFEEKFSSTIKDIEPLNSAETYDLEIIYDFRGLKGLKAEGEIKSNFRLTNRMQITRAKFNRTESELKLQIRNTGQNKTSQIYYALEGNSNLIGTKTKTLNSSQKRWIGIPVNKTRSLNQITLRPEGPHFETIEENLKCTPTEGLEGYWSFNDEQVIENGKKILDLSKNRNHGDSRSKILKESGKVGEAIRFGEKKDHIEIPGSSNIGVNDSVTLSYWINIDEYSANSAVNKDSRYFPLHKKSSYQTWIGPNRSIHFQIGKNNKTKNSVNTGKRAIETQKWHHLAFTYNKSTKIAKIYINENIVKKEKLNVSSTTPNSENIRLADNAESSGRIEGRLDEARIYNRALSWKEIWRLNEVKSKNWAVNSCKIK